MIPDEAVEAAACTCYMTDPKTWTTYGSAVEPGSQWEPNPDCNEHFPTNRRRDPVIPDEAIDMHHAPQPGPQYWDFKCLRCDGLVKDHAPLWLRIARKLGITK